METEMLKIRNLSEEARNVLKKAGPYTQVERFWEDETYLSLYKEFLGHTKYLPQRPTFNQFSGAASAMKKLAVLGYKEYKMGGDIWRKDTEDFINRPDIQTKTHAKETTPLKPKNTIKVKYKGQELTAEIPSNEWGKKDENIKN